MQQSRRTILTSVAGLAGALAGCVSQSGRRSEDAGSDSQTRTTTPTTTSTPDYATCSNRRPAAQNDRGYPPEQPDPLTESNVGEYAQSFEELYQTNYENVESGGLTVDSITTEVVDHGFVVHVDVESGFVTYGTAHADFVPYTASYFINERVVRRFESTDGPVDPREAGIVSCRPG